MNSVVLPSITVTLTGISPLLLHNCRQFLDPTNESNKKFKRMTSARKKTDEQLMDISNAEWLMGLYLSPEGRPIMPGENLERMIIEGARASKAGKQATAGVIAEDAVIQYDGPQSIEELAKDPKFRDTRPVVVQRARIMRTRPCFPNWTITAKVTYIPESINRDVVVEAFRNASVKVGLGDYRPKFGRFTFEIVNEDKGSSVAA